MLKLLFYFVLNLFDSEPLPCLDKNNRYASTTGSAGTTTSMGIVGNIVRKIEIDHMGQIIDIKATGSNVGSHENLQIFTAKFFHHLVALGLG